MAPRFCEDCKSTRIKSRRNYSHGKKSKSTTSVICKDCSSYKVKIVASSTKRTKVRRAPGNR